MLGIFAFIYIMTILFGVILHISKNVKNRN